MRPVNNQVKDQVWSDVIRRTQVWGAVYEQLWDQVWNQVWGQVWDQVVEHTREQMKKRSEHAP